MPGEHHGAFGEDAFGRRAEKIARFFGTPQYIFGQTIVVVVWIAINAVAVSLQWDPYPFILLNLAQTRQADRDKLAEDRQEHHHDEAERLAQERVVAIKSETDKLTALLESNTDLTRQDKELTEQVADLTKQIHDLLIKR